MISYVQPGFEHPAFVLDPIPSVAEYLNNYEAMNEAWYRSFAAPLEGGGYGARASSFERRGLPPENVPSAVAPPSPALPPVIDAGPSDDTSILGIDRPSAIVRDPATASDPELLAEMGFLSGPGKYLSSIAGTAAGGGTPFTGLISGLAGRSRVSEQLSDVINEFLGQSLGNAEEQAGFVAPIESSGMSDVPDIVSLLDDLSGPSEGKDRGTDYTGPGAAGETWTGPGGVFV